jgi:bifunctional ADP-heptose synthase (sugar kinase/adenylyltransferase)
VDSAGEYLALIDALANRRVAVIGDVVADEFVYGRVARVSREAPVLILEYDSTEVVPGGAGNAANNVAGLGGRARLAAVVGRDEPGTRLIEALHRRVDRAGVVRLAGAGTPVKTRILAGGIHSAKQQVVRIDKSVGRRVDPRARKAFERAALKAVKGVDAVLVSDYGSGLVTPALVSKLRRASASAKASARLTSAKASARLTSAKASARLTSAKASARLTSARASARLTSAKASARQGPPILIDTRYRLLAYRGLTACTPNESEVEQALGVRINDNVRTLEAAGRDILAQTKMQAVLITRGSRGMALFEPEKPTVHISIFGSDEIADVTGAGDTVMATVTLALAAGATFEQAARLANFAGGIVVMKRGTATVSAAELRDAVRRG